MTTETTPATEVYACRAVLHGSSLGCILREHHEADEHNFMGEQRLQRRPGSDDLVTYTSPEKRAAIRKYWDRDRADGLVRMAKTRLGLEPSPWVAFARSADTIESLAAEMRASTSPPRVWHDWLTARCSPCDTVRVADLLPNDDDLCRRFGARVRTLVTLERAAAAKRVDASPQSHQQHLGTPTLAPQDIAMLTELARGQARCIRPRHEGALIEVPESAIGPVQRTTEEARISRQIERQIRGAPAFEPKPQPASPEGVLCLCAYRNGVQQHSGACPVHPDPGSLGPARSDALRRFVALRPELVAQLVSIAREHDGAIDAVDHALETLKTLAVALAQVAQARARSVEKRLQIRAAVVTSEPTGLLFDLQLEE